MNKLKITVKFAIKEKKATVGTLHLSLVFQ